MTEKQFFLKLAKKMTMIALINKLECANVSVDEHYILFSAPHTEEGRDYLNSLYGELVSLQFTKPLTLEESEGQLQLLVDTGSDAWATRCPLYLSVKHFWEVVSGEDVLPDFYFICEGKSGSWKEHTGSLFKIKTYFLWKGIFKALSDHKGTSSSAGTYVYFISTEKGAKKHEINPTLTLVKLNRLDFSQLSHDIATEIKGLIEIKDAHARERRDVLRTTLSDILDEDHSDSSFEWVVTQCKKFQKKFRENYDVYVHRFSVNKLLSEIEEKVSDYISKINESVSSSQNKAFAIPGALIAIAALVKGQDFLSVALVCFGLYFVMFLTKTTNSIYFESFTTLEGQIRKSLHRYEVIKGEVAKDEAEIRISAEEAKNKLLDLLGGARDRINVINKLATAMFVLGVLYSFFSLWGADVLVLLKQYLFPVIAEKLRYVLSENGFDRWFWLRELLKTSAES
ncbi:hypothetical protein AO260_24845 [Pseudomonas sp. ABAC21]|nr:hypothetical protein AO260_24845 [Pseudomonas sp. ABAC21]